MNAKNGNIIIDKEFDETIMVEVKDAIAFAFISLESKIKDNKLNSSMCGKDENFINEKAHQAKCEIAAFIDAQVERLIGKEKEIVRTS